MNFIINKSTDGQFFFILKTKNGETVAISEMYKTKQSCKKGISAVRKSLFAGIIDLAK